MRSSRNKFLALGNTLRSAALFLPIAMALGLSPKPTDAQVAAPAHNHSAPRNTVQAQMGDSSDSQTTGTKRILLTLPSDSIAGTLKATLNGKDVSQLFTPIVCTSGDGLCYTGELSQADGLRSLKNVVYVIAKRQGGAMASSRLRFEGEQTIAVRPQAETSLGSGAKPAVSSLQTITPNYLDPSIPFTTNTPGGYQTGVPWLTIGTTTYPPSGNTTCGLYLVIVLDRQTLTQTGTSPYCFTSGEGLSNFLSGLSGNDLVIVGTVNGTNADLSLNTKSIGGTDYTSLPSGTDPPLGYMAIGVPGAAAGQAYENFYTADSPTPDPTVSNPQAQGMLVEDLNGNYNFQSSNALEYIVAPNDPSYAGQSTVTIHATRTAQQTSGVTKYVYTSGTHTTGGFYLLILQREDLSSLPGCQATSTANGVAVYQGCGTFYATGDSSNAGASATAAYLSLAKALQGLQRNELAVLTTVGDAAFANTANPEFQVASTSASPNGPYAFHGTTGTDGLWNALQPLGAPVFDILYLYPQTPHATYTYITAPGLGNSLNGRSVLSTSLYSQQGETGYVHGIFARDNNGLYAPGRTSQETSSSSDYANFTMAATAALQPTPWPERVTSTSQSQRDAYAYLSYYLLTTKYVQGISGPHQYDIHYLFTGSLNTLLDYHTFDPSNAVFPGTAPAGSLAAAYRCTSYVSGTCTWTSPDPNYPYTGSFTQADFDVVASELHGEIVNLANTLSFLVTGSVNMKDIVAAGSANTALALVGAASTVQGSSLQPAPSAPAKLDVGNLISMIGAGLNVAATIGTGGLVPPDIEEETVASIDTAVSVVGDLLGEASTVGGGLSDGGGSESLPGANYSFVSEIGQLANQDLQGQMSAGFDSTVDVLVSDPVKLALIGAQVVNTTTPGFYAPTQTAQNVALALINQGTQRSLYFSLFPQKYQVQYWPTVFSAITSGDGKTYNAADMGWLHSGTEYDTCNLFYSQSPPNYATFWVPKYQGFPPVFPQDESTPAIDYYLLAAPMQNAGKSNASANFPDAALLNTLFSNQNGGLNLPVQAFMAQYGPMDETSVPASSDWSNRGATWVNLGMDNITGYSYGDICSGQQVSDAGGQVSGYGVGSRPRYSTTTTLTAPTSSVLGDPVSVSATVTSTSGKPPVGTVEFDDGSSVLGTATLDSTGATTFTASGLALGSHSLLAYYVNNGANEPSVSTPVVLTVYSTAPDISLSLSASALPVTYGTTSQPVTLGVTSKWGMSGNVTFSCSGLPAGMSCNFTPPNVTLGNGGSASASFTITGAALTTSAGLPSANRWVLILVLLLPLRLARRRRWFVPTFLVLLFGAGLVSTMTGCSGSPNTPSILQDTGSKTVQVIATSGTLTRTQPLVLNVQ